MLIGSVEPFSGKNMLVSSVENAIDDGETTLMIFTGAPQNTRRTPLDLNKISEGKEIMKKHGLTKMVVHAPYVINLANTLKQNVYDFSVQFLKEEIERSEALGATQIVLHPGSHIGAGVEAGLKSIVKGLNEVLTKEQTVQIAIETMAGKGTEVGTTFEQLAYIIEHVKLNDKLSVTFDTCHTNDAGYKVKDDFENVLKEFDHIIGIDRLKVVHLNDSKNPLGSHKDRHENIGFGTIGFDALNSIAHNSKLQNVPKILETPSVDGKSPYKYEVAMIKNGVFDHKLKEKIKTLD